LGCWYAQISLSILTMYLYFLF